jgi:hypothetical protein
LTVRPTGPMLLLMNAAAKCFHPAATELESYTRFANGIRRYGIDAACCPDCGKVGRYVRPARIKANGGHSQFAIGGLATMRWR